MNEERTDPEEEIAAAIDGAEEYVDPLEGLVERTRQDPGVPFQAVVVEALARLKSEDKAAYESLRHQLKLAKCRVTVLDALIASVDGSAGTRGRTQADVLVDQAGPAELFHDPDETAYADITEGGIRRTFKVDSRSFKSWLRQRAFAATGTAPNSESMKAAIDVLSAKALYEGPEQRVYVRIAPNESRLYLDLCDSKWQVVEIDEKGWRICVDPPVRFRRSNGTRALPVPAVGGSIELLRPLLNLSSDDDFVLVTSYLLATFRDTGPYPILVISGEQGSAKSTFARFVRALVDPNGSPIRSLPRSEEDLIIQANNSHILGYDNLSGLSWWMSDALCRLSTGGGFGTRELYTNQGEVLFDAQRPIILNGIDDIATRADLADRAIVLNLKPIADADRQSEKDLNAAFDRARPLILGALLDGVSECLRNLGRTRTDGWPRMADFSIWAASGETAFWPTGTFEGAYRRNIEAAVEVTIEADPIAMALRGMMADQTEWNGTATQLQKELIAIAGLDAARQKSWPKSASALSGRLRRIAPPLRRTGISVTFDDREGKKRTRIIYIRAAEREFAETPSAASASSASTEDDDSETPGNARFSPSADEADAADGVLQDWDEEPYEPGENG